MEATTATATAPRARNMERFMTATGKTEGEYLTWATEVGKRMHINSLDKLVCATRDIYTVAHLGQLLTPVPNEIEDIEARDAHLIDHSENALELAEMWLRARGDAAAYVSVDSILAEHLNPFPKTDFERFGDANWVLDVSKNWFKKDGTNLDTQIQEIAEVSGFVITEADAVDFVMRWKPRRYRSPATEKLGRIEDAFKELTTFGIKEYYAQHLLKSCYYVVPSFEVELPF